MKKFQRANCIVLFLFIGFGVKAQTLKKLPVGHSACSLYTYCDMKFESSKSLDSSTVYAGECGKDGVIYGIICVKLVQPRDDLNEAETLTIAYLEYLKNNFGISSSAGFGKGHRLNNNPATRGIIDYWEDKDKNKWKVKAWTNGKFIAVLYGYSAKVLPEAKLNVFLDGFRFP